MQDSQGGGESYPAESVRRRCMKNSPSVLSCIGKRTKEERFQKQQRDRSGGETARDYFAGTSVIHL